MTSIFKTLIIFSLLSNTSFASIHKYKDSINNVTVASETAIEKKTSIQTLDISTLENTSNLSPEIVELIFKNGDAYLNEKGLPFNPKKAFIFFEYASKYNHPRATLELGRMYEFWPMWHDTPQQSTIDNALSYFSLWNSSWYLKKSFEYYLKAAQLGDIEAMSEVGFSYYSGRGVPKNIPEAYFWFSLGSQNNHYLSNYHIKNLEKDLTSNQIDLLQEKLNKYKK